MIFQNRLFKINIFILLTSFSAFSQNNYQVQYKMTTLFDGIKNYDANLTFSEQNSCFEYKLSIKDTATAETQDENGHKIINFPNKNKQSIFINFKDKKITELKKLKSVYLVEDTLSIPKWNITNEIKNINNLQCQKATTFYKGRTYEVWYAIEYPSIFGPWKLNGLPGLIILAQDEKREVFFEAIEIQKIDRNTCQLDNSIKHISKNDFDKLIKNWQKDYEERLKSMGDRNLKLDVKFGKAVDIEILD
ncbi:GLPGLI family protein [Flavobacterium sp.]|uniref:GLPGLI family protein n=1 Tax=Flavobacterium sp. TaxID=239 RepID=UPI003340CEAE